VFEIRYSSFEIDRDRIVIYFLESPKCFHLIFVMRNKDSEKFSTKVIKILSFSFSPVKYFTS
jgi:hypothetical protein